MMGLGVLGSGSSSSSSSNLSPLAPPFTVDRTNPRPSSSQLVQFKEASFGMPFQSSFHSWQYPHSSASRSDLYSNLRSEVDSIRTTCLPSPDDSRFMGSRSAASSNATAVTDAFAFTGYTNDKNVPNNRLEAKPFYPSFASPDDGTALTEANYDLLSTYLGAPLNRSSLDDYTQGLSGLDCTPQWGSFWNGFSNAQQGKLVELDGRFCSEETNVAASCVYEDYIKQGACLAKNLRKHEEASACSHRQCDGGLQRESQVVPPSIVKLNDEFSSRLDPWNVAGRSSETPASGLGSVLSQSHSESMANFWKHQKSYVPSHDQCFQPLESQMNNHISVKKSSPALVIRSPSTGTGPTLSNTISDVKSVSNAATSNNLDFCGQSHFNRKDPHLSLNLDGKEGCLDASQPSLHMEANEDKFLAFSSTRKEDLSSKSITKDALNPRLGAGTEFQCLNINIPDRLAADRDSAKCFTSFEDSSKCLDHYNSAVDSPCWKGAPASHFATSDISACLTPQYLMKNSEECNNLNLQQTPICSPYCDDTVNVSSQNLCQNTLYQENGYVELGSLLCSERLSNANCTTKKHSAADIVSAGFSYLECSLKNEAQFSNETDRQTKQYAMPNDSLSNSDLKVLAKQSSPDKDEIGSDRELKYCTAVADDGLNVNDTTEQTAPFHGTSTSFLPCSAGDVNDLAKLHTVGSTAKLNVQMLVNTMQNLSDLLLYHCSNDAHAVLSGHECEVLQNVINNLDACILKNIASIDPKKVSLFPQQDSSPELRDFPDLHKDVTVPRMKQPAANSHVRFDRHHDLHEGENFDDFSKGIEKFPDFSLRDDKDTNMVQAIKEILKENLSGEEELQSETSLYKNLWLEAEAALCSISYRARFNHMKAEMQKQRSQEGKGAMDSTSAIEKLPSSKFSFETQGVIPATRDDTGADDSYQNMPVSSLRKAFKDVDTRFKILKCRGESSKSVDAERQQLAGVIDTEFSGRFSASSVIETPNSVEKLLSSKFSSDPTTFGKVTSGSSDETSADNSCQDYMLLRTKKASNDVDAYVLARFEVLKLREENSNCFNGERQQLGGIVDAGFSGKRNTGPFAEEPSEDGVLDVSVEPRSRYGGENSKLSAFGSYTGGSKCGTVGSSPGRSAGDQAILSEWEQVWKDELASQMFVNH